MSVSLSPLARMQFNQSGIPLAGGLLFTYAAGTTTKLATYTDSTGGTPNTNPIVLDANGQCDIWLTDTVGYKFVLSPSTDTDPPTNAYWTKDNISNIPSPTPTFTSATITGNLTVGTVNKVTITQPATAATLTIADGRTLTVSNTLTFTGTNGSTVAFGAGGTAVFAGAATASGLTLSSGALLGRTTAASGAIEEITIGSGLGMTAGVLSLTAQSTIIRSARTTNTILGTADRTALVDITSGTFTQTLTAAATLGSGWYCYYRNSGTGDITLDPNGAELIDGLTTYIVYPGECRIITCDGSAFTSMVVTPFLRTWTTSGTFTKPPGYQAFFTDLTGGGGGGGGGEGQAAGNIRLGGSGGGGAGRNQKILLASLFSATNTVTIGAAGTGGAGGTGATGSVGNAGGNTSIGSIITAYGGGAGFGSTLTSLSGGAGGGSIAAGGNGTTATVTQSAPFITMSPASNNAGSGGASSTTSTAGCAEWGGGAGAGQNANGAATNNAGSSMFGGCGGGHGGSMTAANATLAGSVGGLLGSNSAGGGGAGGSTGGGAGTGGAATGAGGGGGGSNTGGTGGRGGDGGSFGDGGGGGGGGTNIGGAGGNGIAGRCIVGGII